MARMWNSARVLRTSATKEVAGLIFFTGLMAVVTAIYPYNLVKDVTVEGLLSLSIGSVLRFQCYCRFDIMDEPSGPSPSARATIVLSAQDELSASASVDHSSASAALVERKGKCMDLGEYLLKQNTPLEEPDEVLGTEAGSDDEEDPPARAVPHKKRK